MISTFERLRAILVKDYQLAPDAVTMQAKLESLGIDSLGVAELLFMDSLMVMSMKQSALSQLANSGRARVS